MVFLPQSVGDFPAPFLDLTDRASCCGERGLLGLAFHPDFWTNGYFFVDYTNNAGDTVIARYRVSADPDLAAADSELILLTITQPFPNHNGGQLAFGPDGKLYVGMGDGGAGGDPRNVGQNPASLLGKLLRTNPLAVRWEIAGYGLRNPWRFSFDRATGDLYIGDVGQNAIEEVDFRPRGAPPANFGWARFEGSERFGDVELDPPSPLVFPQFVSGGGYETEVILLGSDSAATTTLYRFTDN